MFKEIYKEFTEDMKWENLAKAGGLSLGSFWSGVSNDDIGKKTQVRLLKYMKWVHQKSISKIDAILDRIII